MSARQTYLAFFWTVRLKKPLQPSQVLKIKIYESIANISTNIDQSLKNISPLLWDTANAITPFYDADLVMGVVAKFILN